MKLCLGLPILLALPVSLLACSPGDPSQTGEMIEDRDDAFQIPDALPDGAACVMNVGNADFWDAKARAYTYKVKSCDVLIDREHTLGKTTCDAVGLIELLSDDQCACACGDPDAVTGACEAAGWEPDDARCALCLGCGAADAPTPQPSCENQASVVCDPARYDISCNTSARPVGCDCVCRLKSDDVVNDPEPTVLVPPQGCEMGNQGLCVTRSDPKSGQVLDAICLVHPDHCGGVFGTNEDCIESCSTPLVKGAFELVSEHKGARQRVFGDWNCGAAGECNYPGPDYCMWTDLLEDYDLELCPVGDLPTALPNYQKNTPCILDFGVSNACTACDQRVIDANHGDHQTVVLGEACEE